MKSHSRYVQTLDFSRRVVAHNFALPHLQSLPLGRCPPSSMLLGVRLAILIPAIVNFWFANAYYATCYLCDGAGILYPYNTVLLTDAVTGETIVYSCIDVVPFLTEDCDFFKSFAEPICGCPYQASPFAYQPPFASPSPPSPVKIPSYQPPFASPSPPSPVKIPPYPTQSIDNDATPFASLGAILGYVVAALLSILGTIGTLQCIFRNDGTCKICICCIRRR